MYGLSGCGWYCERSGLDGWALGRGVARSRGCAMGCGVAGLRGGGVAMGAIVVVVMVVGAGAGACDVVVGATIAAGGGASCGTFSAFGYLPTKATFRSRPASTFETT